MAVVLVFPAFSGDFDDKGAISGWSFAPIQLDVGFIGNKKLVDESSNTFFSFGVFLLQQKSAVISVALVANMLQNNYGIQLNPLFLGTVTDNNYGISWGVENYSKKCYGLQLGILNHSFAGEKIKKERDRVQICGINIADTVFLGLLNFSDKFQIGLFNFSPDAIFQIGLLNYNQNAPVPWMPFFNFSFDRKKE